MVCVFVCMCVCGVCVEWVGVWGVRMFVVCVFCVLNVRWVYLFVCGWVVCALGVHVWFACLCEECLCVWCRLCGLWCVLCVVCVWCSFFVCGVCVGVVSVYVGC